MSPLKRTRDADLGPATVYKKLRTRKSATRVESPNISARNSRSVLIDGADNAFISNSSTNSSGLSASTSSVVDKYTAQEDEVSEDEVLCDLLGESVPAPGGEWTLPVRFLSYFDIYDCETEERKILPLDIDPDADSIFYGASGFVRPKAITESEDGESSDVEEDNSILVRLNVIKEAWTNRRDIWIRTNYAWYILEYPSRAYRIYLEKLKVRAQNYVENRSSLSRSSRARDSSTPFLTPRVGKIAQGLFLRSLLMMGKSITTDPHLQNVCVPEALFVVHSTNPSEIVWGERIPGRKGFYKSVFLDGVEYHVDDTVAVAAPSLSSDGDGDGRLSSRAWFAQIRYLFDRGEKKLKQTRPQKCCHLRWFSHGSQTILGETSNPQALFLLDECDDNSVETILQKITVHHLGADDLEPVIISDKDVGSNVFHLRYKWNSENMTMSTFDLEAECSPTSSSGLIFSEQPAYKRCYSCAVREQNEVRQAANKLHPDVLEIFEKQYHVHDFVYVKKKGALLAVSQIVDLFPNSGNSTMRVSIFDRLSPTSEEERTPKTERSLLHTGEEETVAASDLDGHCFVLRSSEIEDTEAWLQCPDNFILMGYKKPLKQCSRCRQAHQLHSECEKVVRRGALRALDLFSGAGGLTTGMEMSGFVKTCWAVERNPSAAESIRNHEDAVVYNQDCNVLLRHALETQEGKDPNPVCSLGEGKEILPPLPHPGEVDLIMGVPPCQPFSGMNRFKRVDDVRQTYIPTFLSYVECYSPPYVLLESVTGLLYYRLKGRQEGRSIVGGIEAGMVKFIMRAFTSLGYQVQMRVLNSADYGSPQQRSSVVFWAARLDVPLPKWPTPTHIPRVGYNSRIRRVADIGVVPVASRTRNELENGHQHAPFYSVTVREAIDDLPSWDWQDPDDPRGIRQPKGAKPTFPADIDQAKSDAEDSRQVSGYSHEVLYASPPRNISQAGLRKGQGTSARVDLHCTALFTRIVVKRTINIPIEPLANFTDLPQHLKKPANGRKERKTANNTYWRLDGEGQFRSLRTVVNPDSKGACEIHPYDKRVLTVREQARAQGFPDYYQFCSLENGKSMSVQVRDMERQIGNALPVHLAYALGRGLGEDLVEAEMKRRRDSEDVMEESGWDARTAISEEL